MIYEFMDDKGRIIEQSFAMADAPSVGTIVDVDDPDTGEPIKATRIYSSHEVRGDNWKPYISDRLPRHMKGVPCTPGGKPIITSRSQEREICAEHGYVRE